MSHLDNVLCGVCACFSSGRQAKEASKQACVCGWTRVSWRYRSIERWPGRLDGQFSRVLWWLLLSNSQANHPTFLPPFFHFAYWHPFSRHKELHFLSYVDVQNQKHQACFNDSAFKRMLRVCRSHFYERAIRYDILTCCCHSK